jgi:hypothetical protein
MIMLAIQPASAPKRIQINMLVSILPPLGL